MKLNKKNPLLAVILSLAGLTLSMSSAFAAGGPFFWDNNGGTADFGTAAGTWATPTIGTSTLGWSTSPTGIILPGTVTTDTTDALNFGNANIPLAAGTIIVGGTVNAASLNYAASSGAIVLADGTINLAAESSVTVNNASNSISSAISGASTSLTKAGTGSVILFGANTYTGSTNIKGGTLQIGNSTSGSLNGLTGTALNFSGSGGINVQKAAGISQGMGALTFSAGDGGVTSTWNNGTGSANTALTFDSLTARTKGATANFTLAGTGSTATNNRIALVSNTNAPLTSDSNNPGIFFGSNSYARYNAATNTFQAVVYGTSSNANASLSGSAVATLGSTTATSDTQFTGATRTTTTSGVVSGTQTNTLAVTNGTLFKVGQILTGTNIAANTYITGISTNTLTLANAGGVNSIGATAVAAGTTLTPYNSVTAQTTASANTLNLSGVGASLTLSSGQTLSVNGILRSAGTAAASSVISGGTGIQTATAGTDLVVRTSLVTDVLTIASPILNNGGSSLTKSGAGTLMLSSANTYTGGTYLTNGIVRIANAASFGTGNVNVTGSSRINVAGGITYANTINVDAPLSLQIPLFVQNANPGSAIFSGPLNGSSPISVIASSTNGAVGTFAFTNTNNTFTGDIIMPAGTTASTPTASGNDFFSFSSIGDGGTFTFQKRGHTNAIVYTGSTDITFNNRRIVLGAEFGNGLFDGGGVNPINRFMNNGTGTVTFNTNLTPRAISTISATASLFFDGTNTGNNTFAGLITNRTNATTLGIGKNGSGKWILTNANSYLGNTTIADGVLSVNTIEVAANNQPLGKSLLIQLGNSGTSGTLEFTGSTNSTTNKQVILGNLTNNNQVGAGGIVNNGDGTLTFSNSIFNSTTGATVTTVSRTLTLGGSNAGDNKIAGIIQNNASGAATVLTKTGVGTWILAGTNTFSGNINLNAGTLVAATGSAFGSANAARTITVSSGALLRFDSGNVMNGTFASTSVPTIIVNSGTVTNNFGNNNALGNITLNNSTLDSTAGSVTYGAFNINGTLTSTGNSTIASSEPITGRMMLSNTGTIFNVTTGELTISAPLAAVAREGHLGSFTKNGSGTLRLNGANTYSGSTTLNGGVTTVGAGGTLGSGLAALSVNGTSTILDLATDSHTVVGSLSGTGTPTIYNGGSGMNFTVNQTVSATFAGVIEGAGDFTLGNRSSNTLTFTGTPIYSGSTTVNAGTLKLDYATNDTSKLSDTAALILGGGTLELSGGTHTEVVNSTSLSANTNSRVTSSSPAAVLQLNTITAGAGATIDFSANNIATTDSLNDASGILGTWATVGGVDFAMNATNAADGLIVAYTGYADVPRTNSAAQVIVDSSTANVRIIEGTGSTANLTLGAATTTINTLNQSLIGGTSPATIAPAGQTLRVNSILMASGAGALTIGAGTLSTATTGGLLSLNNNSIEDFTVDAVIANHTSASGLNKSGSGWLILNAANTYTGATVVGAGTLNLIGSITGSAITVNGSSVFLEDASGVIAGSSSLTLASTATSTLTGTNTHSGGTTLSAGNLILANSSALGTGSFTLSGGNFNTDGIITSLASNNPLNWNGNFTFGGASDLNIGTGAVTLGANSQVTVNASTLTVGGVISGAFSVAKAGAGTLVLNGANTHSGGTLITGSSSAGKLILGHASALGTGPLTINGNGTNTIDSSVPNLVNAGNNVQNWQASFTFTGTENLNLGTGAVTMLGNRTVTVVDKTLTIGGAIAGPGFNLTKSGLGTMVLSGVNTYSGNTNVSDGIFTISGSGSLGSGNYAGAIAITTTLNYDSTAAQTLSGVISGAGNFNKSGASTLTLTNVNTFTGTTTIAAGVLSLGNGSSGGSLAGDIINNASLVVNNNSTATLPGLISGSGTLTKNGTGTLTLPASNDYTGLTNIIAGTVTIGHETALGTSTSGTVVSAGGALESLTNLTVNGEALTLNGNGVSGGGALRVGGNKTLTWEGAITLGSDATIKTDSGSSINISTLGSVNLGSNALTLQLEGSVTSASDGIISGTSGSLIKSGAASLFLAGNNTYTGLTTVNAGSLILQNPLALGTFANGTTVLNGARVELDNLTVANESITLSGNGTNFLGALQGRSGTSVWSGGVLIDAADTRIGAAAGATLEVTGVIDDGVNDHRVAYRPADATATVILSGANTYTGGTTILGPVAVSSLNKVVGGSATSNLGAPTTEANGLIVIGTTTVSGTLKYIGAGETTDRKIQIGANAAPPVVGDIGGAIILNDGTSAALVFNAPLFNSPTNALSGTSPTRTLTLGGTNTAANTISGIIQNNQIANASTAAVAVTKTGASSWTLEGANTYTGITKVSDGSLTLSGGNATSGAIQVSDTAGQNASLTITAGTYNLGGNEFRIGMAPTTAATGTVNQTGGDITFGASGAQLLLGSNVDNVTTSNGVYNLSAGSITIPLSSTAFRGIMIGVNGNNSGSFLLSGTGVLNMTTASGGNGDSNLLIGRPENALHTNITGTFTQTGGTANIGNLSMGGSALLGPAGTQTLTLSGGTFSANSFARFSAGDANIGVINISGAAAVTLPAFPTARGAGATATVNFDGGTLKPLAASATYMGGLTNAFIQDGGVKFDTTNGSITITQALLTDVTSLGGGLTKEGVNALTLTGVNTYTGATTVTAGTLALVGGSQAKHRQ